jgi:ABC-type Fe3+/spermidine/putrescine transport system ATPase subunit
MGRWSVALDPKPHLKTGTTARIFLRPDRIRCSEDGASFDATIVDVTYLGETMRVGLQLRDGPMLVARWSSLAKSVHKGDRVRVTWDSSDLKVF